MSRGIVIHGDGLRAFECGGVGRAVSWMSRCHHVAAFSGDLAFGAWSHQVSATTAFGERWIEQLLTRYNAEGPEALGDLRRRNGATATILKPELLAKLRLHLREPPPDGGLWSRKVAEEAAAFKKARRRPRRGGHEASRYALFMKMD